MAFNGSATPATLMVKLAERSAPVVFCRTTTVRVPWEGSAGGMLLPVRSDRPVPLAEMQKLVRQICDAQVSVPAGGIRKGETLMQDMGRNHANIIAERTVQAASDL